MNWTFTACVACKIQFQTRQKIHFIELNFSNSNIQKSSGDQQGNRLPIFNTEWVFLGRMTERAYFY